MGRRSAVYALIAGVFGMLATGFGAGLGLSSVEAVMFTFVPRTELGSTRLADRGLAYSDVTERLAGSAMWWERTTGTRFQR
jgi:hypothetical protein